MSTKEEMESMKAKNQVFPLWQSMIHYSMNEWVNEWMSDEGKQNEWMNNKEKQYVSYDIGYWKVGEKDGMMMILLHWYFEVIMNWLVMICFVDLPNLTSITSERYSFYHPRVVTLESISEYWILIVFRYSKSSKCQATLYIPESSIEINFEYSLIDLIWFIDVSSILADLVH